MPASRSTDISKYFGAVTALHGMKFYVDAGEVLGVVGDNGRGQIDVDDNAVRPHVRRERSVFQGAP
jgi:ABC-type branched-subunit amino acid transport system ATPase component